MMWEQKRMRQRMAMTSRGSSPLRMSCVSYASQCAKRHSFGSRRQPRLNPTASHTFPSSRGVYIAYQAKLLESNIGDMEEDTEPSRYWGSTTSSLRELIGQSRAESK